MNVRHQLRTVDLDALRGNVRLLREALPAGTRLLAVVKADAYGHGMAQVARAAAWLRQSEKVTKKPSVAESLDWVSALMALGVDELDDETCASTLGFALKNNDEIKEILADDDFIRSFI